MPARFTDLRDRVRELALLEGDVALALLLEADADVVADELVAEGARHAGDAELEPDLLERRGVAGLEALLDEVQHLLARDASRPRCGRRSAAASARSRPCGRRRRATVSGRCVWSSSLTSMPRFGRLALGVASTSRRRSGRRAVVVALTAAAALPALGLRQRDQVALRVRLPEAAGRRQVFEERPDAVPALAHGVQADVRVVLGPGGRAPGAFR